MRPVPILVVLSLIFHMNACSSDVKKYYAVIDSKLTRLKSSFSSQTSEIEKDVSGSLKVKWDSRKPLILDLWHRWRNSCSSPRSFRLFKRVYDHLNATCPAFERLHYHSLDLTVKSRSFVSYLDNVEMDLKREINSDVCRLIGIGVPCKIDPQVYVRDRVKALRDQTEAFLDASRERLTLAVAYIDEQCLAEDRLKGAVQDVTGGDVQRPVRRCRRRTRRRSNAAEPHRRGSLNSP